MNFETFWLQKTVANFRYFGNEIYRRGFVDSDSSSRTDSPRVMRERERGIETAEIVNDDDGDNPILLRTCIPSSPSTMINLLNINITNSTYF